MGGMHLEGVGEGGGGYGIREIRVQSMGEMRKDFCQNFIQPFLQNFGRGSCNDGSRELIEVFHNPHQKCRPPPSVVALTLEYFVGGLDPHPIYPRISSPASSPLHSLFVMKAKNASYQTCSKSLNSL